jgi:adenosylcobinamide-GDP ribazoletransferase
VLVTGAFHEDGFADVCDGFGGGTSADRVLAIMKDSRLGAYGAIGITLLLGLKWAALAAIAEAAQPGRTSAAAVFAPLVIGSHMTSRWCAGALMWSLPYVRVDGDSKSRAVAEGFSAREWRVGGVIALVAFAPIAAICVREGGVIVTWALVGWALAAGAMGAATVAWIAASYFRRRIGGHTGDCLGAVQQVTELCFLMAGLAVIYPQATR